MLRMTIRLGSFESDIVGFEAHNFTRTRMQASDLRANQPMSRCLVSAMNDDGLRIEASTQLGVAIELWHSFIVKRSILATETPDKGASIVIVIENEPNR